MLKRIFFALLPIGVMGLIFFFSSQPYEQQDLRPTMKIYIPLDLLKPLLEPIEFTYHGETVNVENRGVAGMLDFLIRKAAHLTVFFLLMASMFLALVYNTTWSFARVLTVSYIGTVLYACFDEYHQSLTPNRTPYAGDVVLDSFGGVIALLFIGFVYWRKKKRQQHAT
ncbi:VanZ like family protein [Halobacillus karajensis]|uniref:Integral membrane protein n=1 Tax=Halobacillus karajensis TaxID=195088 RepID=A0A059NWZ0_9BACI|nr:VanZ family protein [Halobacillus karajensis]CDQ18901.1 putative integral membrane protein [Halobacillus karajensis]CDQ23026.1 putative integral membrane protein [Halobacillus karajensis]CDQ26508.1 putative integral membrane protein [Halobacillus karajensis]SEH44598.1 VanZ like family protein [Halobacillus karajensis]